MKGNTKQERQKNHTQSASRTINQSTNQRIIGGRSGAAGVGEEARGVLTTQPSQRVVDRPQWRLQGCRCARRWDWRRGWSRRGAAARGGGPEGTRAARHLLPPRVCRAWAPPPAPRPQPQGRRWMRSACVPRWPAPGTWIARPGERGTWHGADHRCQWQHCRGRIRPPLVIRRGGATRRRRRRRPWASRGCSARRLAAAWARRRTLCSAVWCAPLAAIGA